MKLMYFAWLRERVGMAQETVEPPPQVRTVGQLIDWLRQRSPGHAEALADLHAVRCAVNQDYAELDAPVAADDEVAFFPPVTGGRRR
ncbi:MAG: molybdopterin converting factor subunit 1 [Alphaproteobacteria bacterium]|nr:molybdopterin converting factor subunit 1 [Alphaproteobacteria bacterium]